MALQKVSVNFTAINQLLLLEILNFDPLEIAVGLE